MRWFLSVLLSAITISAAVCQSNEVHLSLEDALLIGQEQSLISKENKNTLTIAYWQYRDYRADLFPSISLDGTLPSLNRSLSSYQQEDGTFKFIHNDYVRENLGLTVSQAIPFTGGKLYIQSSAERIDQLSGLRNGSFLTIPFNVTLTQPIFAFNPFKWARRIEPLKYQASKQSYVAAIENVNIMTVNYYFDLLLSLVNRNIARQNLQNSKELYRIALAKKKIGVISEDEIMQLHVGVLNSNAAVIAAEKDYLERMHALRNYLGYDYDDLLEIIPQIPPEKLIPIVNPELIWEKSRDNNPTYQDFKVRLLEAESSIVRAKRNRNPNVQLYVSVGNTGSNRNFIDSYGNLKNRQIVELGVSIPILDWGKRKGQVELAKSQYALVEDRITREENDFNERVRALIDNINSQPALVELYQVADSIAQKRYKIAFEKFTLGNANVIDINYARQEKDDAKRNYINQLYLSWLYYYSLRYITLYDFETGNNLESKENK